MVSSAIIYLLFVFIFIYFILFLFVMNIVACEDKFSLVGSKTPVRGEHESGQVKTMFYHKISIYMSTP